MRKKRRWDKKSIFFLVVGLAMIAIALFMLGAKILDYKKSNDTYEKLKDKYVQVNKEPQKQSENKDQNNDNSLQDTQNEVEQTEEWANENWWYEEVEIQLDGLLQENADIIGWILFENNDKISYPVLYSGDNEKYLRTDIYGNTTTAGCIFLEGACTPDFQDCHTIVYGHNMRDASMFGSLRNYKTEGYYDEHQYFMIYTKDMAYRYRIFAFYDVAETDDVYQVGFAADDTFEVFVNDMLRQSYKDTDILVTKDDKIITLSTCSAKGYRFVVHAVRVDEHNYK